MKVRVLTTPRRRNPAVVAACLRGGAGPMRHRFAPRGGARNDQARWHDEVAEADEGGVSPGRTPAPGEVDP